MPIHVNKFIQANWSWALAKLPYDGNEKELNSLTDFDSVILNQTLSENPDSLKEVPYIFLVDVKNMLMFKKFSKYGKIEFKLSRTGQNDRSRSRISNRKQYESANTFQ